MAPTWAGPGLFLRDLVNVLFMGAFQSTRFFRIESTIVMAFRQCFFVFLLNIFFRYT